MHERVRKDPTRPVRRVYETTAGGIPNDEHIPEYHNIRSRVQRYRSTFMPPIPSDVKDVVIDGEWRQTWSGQKFLVKLDNSWGLALFSSKRMLTVLQKAKCIYMDGTFRTAPRPYMQIVTVHGLYHRWVIPLAFCLLTGKTVGQYRQFLMALKTAVLRLTRQQLNPEKVVMDFEHSMMIAVETELPQAQVAGCYFHFTQSLWRQVQEFHLASEYRRHNSLQKTIQKVMAIAFLPVILVRQNFMTMRSSRQVRHLVRMLPQLDNWLDYVYQTYIQRNALFPPPVWNVYKRKVYNRTNNHVEGIQFLMTAVIRNVNS